MKRLAFAALLFLVSVPGWSAAKKVTVAELKDMLATMRSQNKSDADVATALKQVQLSEELNRSVMNSLADAVPGQLTLEQIYVLEAHSAMLPPPAADVPAIPPLAAAAQQALLAKASAYASGPWSQLPDLSATKTTLRFQDNVEALSDSSGVGVHNGAADESNINELRVNPFNYIHYIHAEDTPITLDKGQETLPADKTQWGRNKMIQVMDPDRDLATIISEANDSGAFKFERWESVNGKAAAVFSYDVEKKKSRLSVHVCCFPSLDQTGNISHASLSGPGPSTGSATTPKTSFSTNTEWNPYKKDRVPYHGELFIDPDTGIVVRMITQTEEKGSDMVHQDDERIDYAPVTVAGKALVLPVRSIVITEVVPNGDAGVGGYSTRTTLFTSEYKNYALGK